MSNFSDPKTVQSLDTPDIKQDMVAARQCVMCEHYGEIGKGICASCLIGDRSNWKPNFKVRAERKVHEQ